MVVIVVVAVVVVVAVEMLKGDVTQMGLFSHAIDSQGFDTLLQPQNVKV